MGKRREEFPSRRSVYSDLEARRRYFSSGTLLAAQPGRVGPTAVTAPCREMPLMEDHEEIERMRSIDALGVSVFKMDRIRSKATPSSVDEWCRQRTRQPIDRR